VHYYIGYANSPISYPAMDADSFAWTKSSTADGGLRVFEGANYGEPFPGEETVTLQPSAFILSGVSPNPFNPSTTISYELQAASQVSLRVYDTAGRLVATLVEEIQGAGEHHVTFDGSSLPSGLYLYCLTAGQNTAAGKMVLLK
jgi:hypothetical protein